MFNAGKYWERVQSGELNSVEIHVGTPDAASGQPLGTRSKTIEIRDKTGAALAHAHGFIQPGWIIGASGKLDPKRIWKDGILYRIDPKLKRIKPVPVSPDPGV